MTNVNATAVLNMLTENKKVIRKSFDHIALPFTAAEAKAFLDGKPGSDTKHGTRSREIVQAISAIGACLVDQKIASSETVVTYQALWAMDKKDTCKYCGKAFTFKFLMGDNGKVCYKAKCTLSSMHDTM